MNLKIKTKLGNRFRNLTLNTNPNLYRPKSTPFFSGDTLRKYCDHIFDETSTLSPSKVKQGDIVFLKTNLKNIYFSTYHSKIKEEYILVCHNSDYSFDDKDLKLLDSKIIHCFSQNLNVIENEEVSILPIGFENARYRNNGKVKNLVNVKNKEILKKDKIFCSFNVGTNFEIRNNLFEKIKKRDDIDIHYSNNSMEYLNRLSEYKYNLCPVGNGFDTHRIWETLLVDSIPIVERNNVNINFSNLGVPILMLDKWDDLSSLRLNNLNNKNKGIDKFRFTQFDFWWNKIISKKP